MHNKVENLRDKVRLFFSQLSFDPVEHVYTFKNAEMKSASSVYKKFEEKVDFNMIAGFVAKSRQKKGEDITREDVLQEWKNRGDEAIERGNKAHEFAEDYFHKSVCKKQEFEGLELALHNFWESLPEHVVPFLSEIQMFSEELGIAGTSDLVLYDTITEKFIMADYKTNQDLHKNHKGKKLLPPFDDLLDTPFNKYQLQLAIYKVLFELTGYEVQAGYVVWIRDDGTFSLLKVNDYSDKILKEITNEN